MDTARATALSALPYPITILPVRAPVDHITAPAFPTPGTWVNAATQRMERQRGHPVLIEFWDFCRPNSVRTLPYLRAWHERYADAGLRIIGVHASGFAPSESPEAVTAAVERLGIPYPVLVDTEFRLWQDYENLGWPARYLWNQDGRLFEYHYGEGAYAETERAIRELLGLESEPGDLLPVLRPEEAEGAALMPQSEDVAGAHSGPYVAGAVWAVLDGAGTISVNGVERAIAHPGAFELITHDVSTAGTLDLQLGEGVSCLATCFTPGLGRAV